MKKNIKIEKGSSSAIIPYLLGDVKKYIRILEKQSKKLIKKYPNKNLAIVFNTLTKKILTLGPMALCDYLVSDLGEKCDEEILSAIGLICLEISAHDDAVDETPQKRSKLAALVYAGNIAALEAERVLCRKKTKSVIDIISSTVNQNHYLQQIRVEKLWEKKPNNFLDYQKGVKDGSELIKIGLFTALEITNRKDLIKSLTQFSDSYAFILQIIDDIREIKEDKLAGYNSFPLLEGPPFKKSFKAMKKHLLIAEKSLKPEWERMSSLIKNLRIIISKLTKEFDGS